MHTDYSQILLDISNNMVMKNLLFNFRIIATQCCRAIPIKSLHSSPNQNTLKTLYAAGSGQ